MQNISPRHPVHLVLTGMAIAMLTGCDKSAPLQQKPPPTATIHHEVIIVMPPAGDKRETGNGSPQPPTKEATTCP